LVLLFEINLPPFRWWCGVSSNPSESMFCHSVVTLVYFWNQIMTIRRLLRADFYPSESNLSPFVGDSFRNEFFQPSTAIPFKINFSPFVSDSLRNPFFHHSSVFHPSSMIPFGINSSPFIGDRGLVFYPFGINFSPFVNDLGLFFMLCCSLSVGDSFRNQFFTLRR
jgi:hypothetical protein